MLRGNSLNIKLITSLRLRVASYMVGIRLKTLRGSWMLPEGCDLPSRLPPISQANISPSAVTVSAKLCFA